MKCRYRDKITNEAYFNSERLQENSISLQEKFLDQAEKRFVPEKVSIVKASSLKWFPLGKASSLNVVSLRRFRFLNSH